MPRQNLTANACTVCRRKRTKCDGYNPCRRCVSRGEDCIYEDKMWRTKDHLRSEIERLRKEVLQCQGLIKALTIGGPADEWKSIQSRMQRGEPPERIAAWIASSRSPASPYGNHSSSESTEQHIISPDSFHPSTSPESIGLQDTTARHLQISQSKTTISPHSSSDDTYSNTVRGLVSPAVSGASSSSGGRTSSYHLSAYNQESPSAPRSLRSWTAVTHDIELLHRLLYHYFDNCFSDYSFVCKESFMKDLDERTGSYCSSALVNAILGLASQSYNALPDSGLESCSSSQFLAQANELLRTDKDSHTITNIQATGILALAEANIGNDEAAFKLATDCVRKAVLWKMKMDSDTSQISDHGHREAMATTFCGAFSLARIFRILTGRLSCQTGPLFMRLTPDGEDSALDCPEARVERGVSLQQHFFNQLDHCTEPMKFINTITEIAHTFCSYHQDGGVLPADLLPAYAKCVQAWESFKIWLPNGSEISVDVLFAQIWYNYILMILFSTLIESSIDLREGITPKAVVLQASQTIIFLVGVYQEKCGFKCIHPLLPHMVFAATLVQIRRTTTTTTTSPEQNSTVRPQVRRVTTAETAGEKRKRCPEPQTPIATSSGRSSIAPGGQSRSPNLLPLQRSPSSGLGAEEEALVYPDWKQHIAPATMNQARSSMAAATDIKTEPAAAADSSPSTLSASSYAWPPEPASKLAADGTLLLTEIGLTNRKAAELAKVLHGAGRSTSVSPYTCRPSVAAAVAPRSSSFSTAAAGVWKAVNWFPAAAGSGSGNGFGAGFGGLGVDSLQGFSAMTSHHPVPPAVLGGVGVGVVPQAASLDYMVGDGLGYLASDAGCGGIDDSGGNSFGGLYIYPNTLPQMGGSGGGGSFDGFEGERMVNGGVTLGDFAGGVLEGEGYGE